jgi:hypothetical protein
MWRLLTVSAVDTGCGKVYRGAAGILGDGGKVEGFEVTTELSPPDGAETAGG